jgi:UPF0755 protein
MGTLAILIVAIAGYAYNKLVNTRITVKEGNSQLFYINNNDTYKTVVTKLTQQGIVTDYETFAFLAELANYPNKVKAGRYTLTKGLTYIELIRLLRSGKQDEVKVVINAMITPRKLASTAAKYLATDSITLINMFEDSTYLSKYGFTPQNALCMFIPNTYNFYWNTDAEGFMERMKREYDKFWNDKRKQKAAVHDLTPIEVGILASIVDGETNKVDEMSIVAGLYLNRLEKGMMLQADPTVKFALRNSDKQRVYEADLEVESPYNTYKVFGLPPGPLALPSQQAIQAVLNPSKHNYIFMCAKEDLSGYHNFTADVNQHNLNAARYRLALDKLGIK